MARSYKFQLRFLGLSKVAALNANWIPAKSTIKPISVPGISATACRRNSMGAKHPDFSAGKRRSRAAIILNLHS
jgi:hypothetical protein